MASADLLPAAVLTRKAVVYIRQSTEAQVQSNLESRGSNTILSKSPGSGVSATSK